MKRLVWLAVLGMCAGAGPGRAPTTRPSGATTRPASRPAAVQRVRDGLSNGQVRFMVPATWTLASRAENGLSAQYALPDGKGTVNVLVTVQKQAVPNNHPGLRQQLGTSLLAGIKADLERRKVEVVDAPKLEKDAAFMAVIRERFREDGAMVDAMHAYRGVGVYLCSVASSAVTEDAAEAKAVHDAAAMLLMSVTSGPADPKVVRPVKTE